MLFNHEQLLNIPATKCIWDYFYKEIFESLVFFDMYEPRSINWRQNF